MNGKILAIAVFSVLLVTGICYADIPAHVDYHAEMVAPGAGNWVEVKDLNGYDHPVWQLDGQNGPRTELLVDNLLRPEWVKDVWFEIEYLGQVPTPLPQIGIIEPPVGVSLVGISENGLNVTWHWKIIPQPEFEVLQFPDISFYDMVGISKLEVGTYCIPEPAALLLAFMGLGIITLRR